MTTAHPMNGRTALYRLYDSEDRLIYVGITSDLTARWRAHQRDKYWWPEVARKAIEWFETRKSAERIEKIEIEEESPLYNKVFNGPQRRTELYNEALARTRKAEVRDSKPRGVYPLFHGVAD